MKINLSSFVKKLKEILCSVDFWKITIPILIAVLAWSLNEHSRLQWEQYKRKEERYIGLLVSVRGFYASSLDSDLRQNFLDELNKCWLYAPDQIITKGYKFLETVRLGVKSTKEEKERALGDFVVSIRKDLLSRKILDKTKLESKDFKNLRPIGE